MSGWTGSNSTESGVQCTPSMIVPSLMAIRCFLVTTPFTVAIYLQLQSLKALGIQNTTPADCHPLIPRNAIL